MGTVTHDRANPQYQGRKEIQLLGSSLAMPSQFLMAAGSTHLVSKLSSVQLLYHLFFSSQNNESDQPLVRFYKHSGNQ